MKKFFSLLSLLLVMLILNSCIAMKEDVDMAKSQLSAETTAKIKILEENLMKSVKEEVAKLNARIDEIEKSQQTEKQMQKTKLIFHSTILKSYVKPSRS